jgi:hypothetical protein
MPDLKKWLEAGKAPRDFYELIGCPRLKSDRQLLLEAVEKANRYFFDCQNSPEPRVRSLAKQYQGQLAQANRILRVPIEWSRYDEEVVFQSICGEFQGYISKRDYPSDEDIRIWLEGQQQVDPARNQEVSGKLKSKFPPPREVGLTELAEPARESSLMELREADSPQSMDNRPTIVTAPPAPPRKPGAAGKAAHQEPARANPVPAPSRKPGTVGTIVDVTTGLNLLRPTVPLPIEVKLGQSVLQRPLHISNAGEMSLHLSLTVSGTGASISPKVLDIAPGTKGSAIIKLTSDSNGFAKVVADWNEGDDTRRIVLQVRPQS